MNEVFHDDVIGWCIAVGKYLNDQAMVTIGSRRLDGEIIIDGDLVGS